MYVFVNAFDTVPSVLMKVYNRTLELRADF
jgi:hypothetical protein